MKRFKFFYSEACELNGLAKGMSPEDLAKKHGISVERINDAIDTGIKVELEHTNNRSMAKQIAMDHVFEDPDYYKKLKKVEEDAPANNVGSGNIAGASPGETPPKRDYKALLKKMYKRRGETSEDHNYTVSSLDASGNRVRVHKRK